MAFVEDSESVIYVSLYILKMFGYEVPVMGGYPYNQNTTKKIQNYQFKLNEVLGKGNFSKVYRGINELNSTIFHNDQMNLLQSRSSN